MQIVSAQAAPNSRTLFQFENSPVRAVVDAQGTPWFVANDVCRALGIKNSRQAVARLEHTQKGVISSDTLGGRQSVTAVDESGLYELIFTSRKSEAQEFKRWVTQTVLPAIRMDGLYIRGEEHLLSDCLTDDEVAAKCSAAAVQAEKMVKDKLERLIAHREEKDARALGFKLINRGRKRRTRYPQLALRD